jgi:hypothetical protein
MSNVKSNANKPLSTASMPVNGNSTTKELNSVLGPNNNNIPLSRNNSVVNNSNSNKTGTAKSQLGDSRNSIGVYDKSEPHGILNQLPSKNNISKRINNVKSAVSNTLDTAEDKIETVIESAGFSGDNELIWGVLKIGLIVLMLIAVFYIMRYLLNKYQSRVIESPYLLEGIKNAKHALVISQDPNNAGYIPIAKSANQDGIQFTYSFWMLIEGYDYNKGKWKHVFHKGNSSSFPNRAPGVWLHPDTNRLRVYMNSQTEILEFVDVANLPLRKWLHVAVILRDQDLDVYVNGYLKARHRLSSVPKQNNGDFWCNMFGGYEGFMARIKYFPRAISSGELLDIVKDGPGSGNCIGTGEVPPYLDDDWWLNA